MSSPTESALSEASEPLSSSATVAPRRTRAWRKRAGLLCIAILALSGTATASYIWLRPEPVVSTTAPVSAPIPQAPAPVDTPPTHIERRFGDAKTFRAALATLSLDTGEAAAIEAALKDTVDFRRCRSSDRLSLTRSEAGELLRFEYRRDAAHWVEVLPGKGGALFAHARELAEERIARAVKGRVADSLGEALASAGAPQGLAGAFVEIFGGKLRFSRDARKGDRFAILFDEIRIAGEAQRFEAPRLLHYDSVLAGELEAYAHVVNGRVDGYYSASGEAWQGQWMRPPLRFSRISSHFNPKRMHPILKRRMPHLGVDFAAPSGEAVRAAAEGTVSFRGPKGANGNLVSLRHHGAYSTHYAHLLRFAKGLRSGMKVKRGQVIGYVGSTGRSTGPHLHFGVRHRGRFVDPLKVLHQAGPALKGPELARFKRQVSRYRAELAKAG